MKHLFTESGRLKNILKNRRLFLFLDYDGTLTPIVGKPDKAIIPPKAKKLLRKLSQNRRSVPAIITGRSMKDIRKRAGLRNIIYAANHGLQIKGPKIRFDVPVPPDYRIILRHIKKELKKKLADIKGIFIEDKGLSLSLHYRLAGAGKITFVKNIFRRITASYCKSGKIRTETGKKLLEVRPTIKWDKGRAVLWLLQKLSKDNSYYPIYIGDDKTDEDAFKALKNKGLTVIVGKKTNSYARYYIRNTQETLDFIECILKIYGKI